MSAKAQSIPWAAALCAHIFSRLLPRPGSGIHLFVWRAESPVALAAARACSGPGTSHSAHTANAPSAHYHSFIILHNVFLPEIPAASADKRQVKAANLLSLNELARPKQDPINGEHGVRYLFHALSTCHPAEIATTLTLLRRSFISFILRHQRSSTESTSLLIKC